MKVKHFTHIDLDGVACGILTDLAFKKVDIEYCDYDKIDNILQEFIVDNGHENYDLILITDIGINKDTAELIHHTEPDKFEYIDHHKTNLWLNEYFWANVRVEQSEQKDSGTNLLHEYLNKNNYIGINKVVDYFVEQVRRYDTWEWSDIYKEESPKELNDLLYIYGREGFIQNIHFKLIKERSEDWFEDYIINDGDRLVLDIESKRIYEYIKLKQNSLKITNVQGYKAGVVFAEQYISELAHKLLDMNYELDLIIVINMSKGTLSFRSRTGGIDVSEVAKHYNGGGHIHASGCEIPSDKLNKIIQNILN